jgi:hypothetical protein
VEPRTAASVKARPEIVLHGLKPEPRGWLAWLTMTDHERIGIMFGPTGTAGNTPRWTRFPSETSSMTPERAFTLRTNCSQAPSTSAARWSAFTSSCGSSRSSRGFL